MRFTLVTLVITFYVVRTSAVQASSQRSWKAESPVGNGAIHLGVIDPKGQGGLKINESNVSSRALGGNLFQDPINQSPEK